MKQALSFAALSLIQAAAIASVPVPSTSGAVSNEPHALLEIKGLEYSAPHMTMEKKPLSGSMQPISPTANSVPR